MCLKEIVRIMETETRTNVIIEKPVFEEIVKRYIKLVYFFANRFVDNKDDADDIVNETFLKALKRYNDFEYRTDGELKGWLLAISRNLIADSGRKKIILFTVVDQIDVEGSFPEEILLNREFEKERIEAVRNEITKLNPIDQEIIRFRVEEDMNFKEIALAFDTNTAAIKMRYYRSLKKLREVAS